MSRTRIERVDALNVNNLYQEEKHNHYNNEIGAVNFWQFNFNVLTVHRLIHRETQLNWLILKARFSAPLAMCFN